LDLKNYHYYNPYSFFNNRLGFDYAPAQAHTYLNPAPDFIFYSLVVTFPPKLVGFIMGGIHGLNFWLLFLISYYTLKRIYLPADRGEVFKLPRESEEKKGLEDAGGESKGYNLFRPNRAIIEISLLIGVVGLYGFVTIFELGQSFNDNLVSLFILGAILVIIRKMVLERNFALLEIKKELIISGILVGIAIGLKLTQASYGIGIILAIGIFRGDRRAKLVSISLITVSIVVGVFISSGYWMFLMWTKFESPFFPFYNEIFRSPYYTLNNISILTLNPIPKGLVKNLLYPFYIFFDSDYKGGSYLHIRDARYAIIYGLVIVSVVRGVWVKFRRNNEDKARKSNYLLARVSLSLFLFYTAIFPVMQAKSTLVRRLLAQDLSAHLSYVNLFAYLVYVLIAVIVFLIVKNMDLLRGGIGEKSIDKHSKRVALFLLFFFIGSFITWQTMFSIHRYLSPLEILSPLIIVILVGYLVESITLRRWFIFTSFILIIFSVDGPLPKILSWNKSFFRVKVPEMEQLDSSIIFMVGKDPIAYLIPSFPPGARFIRLESYFKFNNPGVETKFREEIKELIQNHDDPFYLLTRWVNIPHHAQLLKSLGLRINRAESDSVISAHEPDGLRLWAVRKENPVDDVKNN